MEKLSCLIEYVTSPIYLNYNPKIIYTIIPQNNIYNNQNADYMYFRISYIVVAHFKINIYYSVICKLVSDILYGLSSSSSSS